LAVNNADAFGFECLAGAVGGFDNRADQLFAMTGK
jgi:hypothetical protein